MEWKDWIGKRIFVRLNTGKVYSGIVIDVEWIGDDIEKKNFYFFTINDRFSEKVGFTNRDISEIKEESER